MSIHRSESENRSEPEKSLPGGGNCRKGITESGAALQIGNVTLRSNLILAPMAGVSDLPFRILCREQGAGLVCMEMISAKAIYYGNKHTEELMRSCREERPVSLQLFGSDPEIMSSMAERIEERPFDLFDINMGCPVQKVVKNGEGSALMRDPKLVYRIVRAMVSRVHKPVMVKIRKGWDEEHVNAVEIAKAAEEAGAAAVTVHGRTREQMYTGRADWEIIRRVKEAVNIPVIGNGDVTGPQPAEEIARATGCDGVMIGRAARGNPWIFHRILECRRTGMDPGPPDREAVKAAILRQAEMSASFKGEKRAISEMRKHVAWYTAGMPHSSALRGKTSSMSTLEDLKEMLDAF